MPTIVTYTDAEPPSAEFPQRIISPSRSSPCCLSGMEDLGTVQADERYEYAYRRCRTCGFTVRTIVRPIIDEARLAAVRKVFAETIGRAFSGV